MPDHRWRDPIQRSALAIKGLTYMPTGATVAALTTSLPETPGGERNWDYRYTWLRDSTFTLQALHYLNLDWEAEEFMQFVADLEPNKDGALQIMYGIDGRRDLTESTREELSGYAGARPGAGRQRRLRPAPERRLRRGARLDPAAHPPQPAPARGGCGRSCRPRPNARRKSGASPTRASGRRGASPSTTSPPSSCAGWRWTAPRSSRASAATPSARPTWRATAEEIKADILAHGLQRRRRPAPALRDRRARRLEPAGGAASASCRGDDERLRASVLAIADDLTEDGFVLRYRTDETDDGMSGKEGSFLICSFWLVSGAGDHRRAAARPRPDGKAAARRLAARALCRGVRHEHRRATWATSRRPSRTSR